VKYVLLIVGSAAAYDALSEGESKQIYADHAAFSARLAEQSAMLGSEELSSEVRIVAPQGSDRIVTAGPFAETAEGVGGWYIVKADDIDAAAEYAKQVPVLPSDHIEVRPIKA
jgi:hypothetical protein